MIGSLLVITHRIFIDVHTLKAFNTKYSKSSARKRGKQILKKNHKSNEDIYKQHRELNVLDRFGYGANKEA